MFSTHQYDAAIALAGKPPQASELAGKLQAHENQLLADALSAWATEIHHNLTINRAWIGTYFLAELVKRTNRGAEVLGHKGAQARAAVAALEAYLQTGGFQARRVADGVIEVSVPKPGDV